MFGGNLLLGVWDMRLLACCWTGYQIGDLGFGGIGTLRGSVRILGFWEFQIMESLTFPNVEYGRMGLDWAGCGCSSSRIGKSLVGSWGRNYIKRGCGRERLLCRRKVGHGRVTLAQMPVTVHNGKLPICGVSVADVVIDFSFLFYKFLWWAFCQISEIQHQHWRWNQNLAVLSPYHLYWKQLLVTWKPWITTSKQWVLIDKIGELPIIFFMLLPCWVHAYTALNCWCSLE